MRRWHNAIFAVSLAFNGALLAGVLFGAYFSRSAMPSQPEPGPFKQLDLTSEQRQAVDRSNLEALIMTARDRMRMKWARGIIQDGWATKMPKAY